MQIKTTARYHVISVTISFIKGQKITRVGKDMKKRVPLTFVVRDVDWYSHYGKQWRFLKKLKIEL